MATKSSLFVCVCALLASNIIAGTGGNMTGFHAKGNASGIILVSQNVSDVKSMLMNLGKENITRQDVQNTLAKTGIASSTSGPCSDSCWPSFEQCLNDPAASASLCWQQNVNCIELCVFNR